MHRPITSIENQTLFALVLAVFSGVFLPELSLKAGFLGMIFLRLLKMVIAPLIFASVFLSVAGLGSGRGLRDLGIKAFSYYLFTTTISVLVGLILVNLIDPGGIHVEEMASVSAPVINHFSFKTFLLEIVPDNIVQSFLKGKVIQIILFALLLGLATLKLARNLKGVVLDVTTGLHDALITLTGWIIRLTPIGVFGIVAPLVATEGVKTLFKLWDYVITVVLGLGIHAVLVLGGVSIGPFQPLELLQGDTGGRPRGLFHSLQLGHPACFHRGFGRGWCSKGGRRIYGFLLGQP